MEQVLVEDIQNLRRQTDSKTLRMTIETLITIYRNIKCHPGDPKYTRIRTGNPAFFTKIWRYKGAADFIHHSGWIPVSQEGDEIHHSAPEFLDVVLRILLENRNVTPYGGEWNENTKHEGKSQEQLREEALKRKAMEQRDEELAACLKDKREREILAEYVRAEHKADRDRVRCLRSPLVCHGSNSTNEIHTLPSSGEQS